MTVKNQSANGVASVATPFDDLGDPNNLSLPLSAPEPQPDTEGETGIRPDDDDWTESSSRSGKSRALRMILFAAGAVAAISAVFVIRRSRQSESPAERMKGKALEAAQTLGAHGFDLAAHAAAHGRDFAAQTATHGIEIAGQTTTDVRKHVRKRVRRAVA